MHTCSLYRSVDLPHCRSRTEERFPGQWVHWKRSGRSCLLEPNGMWSRIGCIFRTVDYTFTPCHNMHFPPNFHISKSYFSIDSLTTIWIYIDTHKDNSKTVEHRLIRIMNEIYLTFCFEICPKSCYWFPRLKVLLQELPPHQRWIPDEKKTPWNSGISPGSGEGSILWKAQVVLFVIETVIFAFNRSLILNGTPWSCQHRMPGRNI